MKKIRLFSSLEQAEGKKVYVPNILKVKGKDKPYYAELEGVIGVDYDKNELIIPRKPKPEQILGDCEFSIKLGSDNITAVEYNDIYYGWSERQFTSTGKYGQYVEIFASMYTTDSNNFLSNLNNIAITPSNFNFVRANRNNPTEVRIMGNLPSQEKTQIFFHPKTITVGLSKPSYSYIDDLYFENSDSTRKSFNWGDTIVFFAESSAYSSGDEFTIESSKLTGTDINIEQVDNRKFKITAKADISDYILKNDCSPFDYDSTNINITIKLNKQ